MSKSKSIGKRILTWIVTALLILGIFGGVSYFFIKDAGFLFVEANGKKYSGNAQLQLSGGTSEFRVLPGVGKNAEYTVRVLANGSNDFTFEYNRSLYHFYSSDETLNDYTEYFSVEFAEKGFTLTIPKEYSVAGALSWQYGGQITLSSEEYRTKAMFVLEVKNEAQTLLFPFTISEPVKGLHIVPGDVVF